MHWGGGGKGAEDGPARLGMPEVFTSLAESKQLNQPGSSLKFSRLYLSVMGSGLAALAGGEQRVFCVGGFGLLTFEHNEEKN